MTSSGWTQVEFDDAAWHKEMPNWDLVTGMKIRLPIPQPTVNRSLRSISENYLP
jgi:hypothetical protein